MQWAVFRPLFYFQRGLTLSRLGKSIAEIVPLSASSDQDLLSEGASLSDKIKMIAAPYLRSLGLELFDLQIAGRQLRVFIDKASGVTLEDCTKLSRLLGPALDVADLMPQAYHLEVSSPGLNRPLRHEADFMRFIGKKIKIKTVVKINMQKVFTGRLNDFRQNVVFMTTDEGDKMRIPFDRLAKACLEVEFGLEQKKKG